MSNLILSELVGPDGQPLPKSEPKPIQTQPIDINAVIYQMGELLIQAGLQGAFAVGVQARDVPFLHDGQPVYGVQHEWSEQGKTEPETEVHSD